MRSALYVIGKLKPAVPISSRPSPTSSMSDSAQAESSPIRELDTLVHHLADELAGFRRRALLAEQRLKDVEGHEHGAVSIDLANRVAELEKENEQLRGRLESATSRAKQMLDRVRFLRQQAQTTQSTAGADR